MYLHLLYILMTGLFFETIDVKLLSGGSDHSVVSRYIVGTLMV